MQRLVLSLAATLLVITGLAFTPLAQPETALAGGPEIVEYRLGSCSEGALEARIEAIQINHNVGIIYIDCSGTINFTSRKTITKDVTIIGEGRVVLDGGNSTQLFFVNEGRLALHNVTLRNGSNDGDGGAIYNRGRLDISDSTFTGNFAEDNGGAIFNDYWGTTEISSSTFHANRAGAGGAIYSLGLDTRRGILQVNSSTFSGNQAGLGSAIRFRYLEGAVAPSISNSIFANGIAGNNCAGPMTFQGTNLSDDGTCGRADSSDILNSDAVNLGPLADNGGRTQTMMPQPGSDAIDAVADCAFSSDRDQRGLFRPETGCDIGAVEVEATFPPTISSVTNSGPVGEGSPATIFVSASDLDGDDSLLLYSYDCDGDGRPDLDRFLIASNTAECPGLADEGAFSVNVWVEDPVGGTATGSTAVNVNNVPPAIGESQMAPTPTHEGESVVASATFSDPGANDTHTCTVDYGNGPQAGAVNGNTCTGPEHTYLDDGPSGSPLALASVVFEVIDNDGGVGSVVRSFPVNDVAPVVDIPVITGGPSVEGESVDASATFSDAGILDTHTCEIDWGDGTVNAGTIDESDGSGTCDGGSHTYVDYGSYTVTITVTNDDTGEGSNSVVHTIDNVLPTVNPVEVSSSPVHEGQSVVFSASFTDPGINGSYTCVLDYGDGSVVDGTVTGNTCTGPEHTYVDDGDFTVSVYVCDDDRIYQFCSRSSLVQTVNNVAPSITQLQVGPTPSLVNAVVTLNADFTDPGERDIHAATIDWGDGVEETVQISGPGSGSVEHSHSYAAPGSYSVTLTVFDSDDSDTEVFDDLVVTDNSDRATVRGNGRIDSPAGAYRLDPEATGTARFNFVSRYRNGESVPTGNTVFRFRAGDLRFRAESFESLIVDQASSTAQFEGLGTINGESAPVGELYQFMIWAGDGETDTLRIRIWYVDGGSEVEIYDNGPDQPIARGRITIK